MIGKLLLSIFSYNNMKETVHREHKDYDFVKQQKGELEFVETPAEVYICNNTSFIDWFYLSYKYSPCFTRIVIHNGRAGLRILGWWESIWSAIGLKFPEESDTKPFYSLKELRDSDGFLHYKGYRPVVVFPEGTKTNGCGILNLDQGIVDMIHQACGPDENLRVHAIRFDHIYRYFACYNSYDEAGFRFMLSVMTQFSSKMVVQYY
jgi:1-acyl-sn-glycerol-3-phosphate acyltransferase